MSNCGLKFTQFLQKKRNDFFLQIMNQILINFSSKYEKVDQKLTYYQKEKKFGQMIVELFNYEKKLIWMIF